MGCGAAFGPRVAFHPAEDGPAGIQDGPAGIQDGPAGKQDGPAGIQDGPAGIQEPAGEAEQEWDLSRYQDAEAVFDALATLVEGHHPVRLLRMTWLIQQRGFVIPRRQDLPEEAFISSEELRAVWELGDRGGYFDKVLPVISISFCWDSPEHPDPRGLQLKLIADTLEAESKSYAAMGFKEMGIFWDWPSLLQGDIERVVLAKKDALANGKSESEAEDAGWDAFRTKAEKAAFDHSLHCTMDLWYAHQCVTTFLLTQHPRERGSQRPNGYEESGWTTYERCTTEQIRKVYRHRAQWPAVMDLGGGHGAIGSVAGRRWPVGPDSFDHVIETFSFTNGADRDAVKELYRRMSRAQFGGVGELDFEGMPKPSFQDAANLAECLGLCCNLERLVLSGIDLRDGAFAPLAAALASGKLGRLKELYLTEASLEPRDGAALAAMLQALPELRELGLDHNALGPEFAVALAGVLPCLPQLRQLWLRGNALGPEGAMALALALPSVPQLTELGLGSNALGPEGEEVVRAAWGGHEGLLLL